MALAAPPSHWDESLKDLVRPYHLVWVNGLVKHLSVTPEEAERMKPEIEKSYYQIKPCDWDRIKYVPSESNPHFLCKATCGGVSGSLVSLHCCFRITLMYFLFALRTFPRISKVKANRLSR